MRKKLFLFSTAALGALAVTAMGFSLAHGSVSAELSSLPDNAINATAEKNALITSEGTNSTTWFTDKGNSVAVSYSKTIAAEGKLGTFQAGATLENIDAINGIESFVVNTASDSGSFSVDYYSTQWHVGSKILIGTVDMTINAAGQIDVSPLLSYETKPDYFKVTFHSEVVMNSIAVNYACNGENRVAYGTSAYEALGGGHVTDYSGTTYCDGDDMARDSLAGVYARKDVDAESLTASHHYQISAQIGGTFSDSVPAEHNYGLLVYYADANNYLTLEARYRKWDRAHEIRSIVLSGKIAGETKDAISEVWTDGCAITPAAGFTLTAEVTVTLSTSVKFTITGANGWTKTDAFSASFTETSKKVGIAAFNDVASFSNWNMQYLAEPEVEIPCEYEKIGSPNIHQYLDGRTIVGGCGWKSDFAAKPLENGSTYSVSADITGSYTTAGNEAYYGFLAYYVDSDNFLLAYIQYSATERSHEIRELQCIGTINGVDAGWVGDLWCDGSNVLHNVTKSFRIDVTVTSSLITINASMTTGAFTKTGTWTKGGTDLQPSTKAGLWTHKDPGATYTNVVIG